MLKMSIIGVGNAGNQVAALAVKELGIKGVAINASEKDLSTLSGNIEKILIGDERGSGKERRKAKEFLKKSIMKIISDPIIEDICDTDIIVIISSTGGGTGSGSSLILSEILSRTYEENDKVNIITIGILPAISESLSSQVNTLEYLNELKNVLTDGTFMLYDNDKLSNISVPEMMKGINQSIVDDLKVIKGTYQYTTTFASIDENDLANIIATPGRLVVASSTEMLDKDLDKADIEDRLISDLKYNNHAELQLDGIVGKIGVISNLSDKMNHQFNTYIPKVEEYIGTTDDRREHVYINMEKNVPNNVFLIASGMSHINDRTVKIAERIEEIQTKRKNAEEESVFDSIDMSSISSAVSYGKKKGDESDSVDVRAIFDKFDI